MTLRTLWRTAAATIAIACLLTVVQSVSAVTPTLTWSDVWNAGQAWADEARHICVTSNGEIFVVGHSYTSADREDIIVLRYASDGTQAWTRRYAGALHFDDMPFDVAIAANDDLLIAGSSRTMTGNDVLLLRYDAAGEVVWEKSFPTTGQWSTIAEPKLDVDGSGRIALCATHEQNYLALLYDADGMLLWNRTWDDPLKRPNLATDIAIDAAGRVIVTGHVFDHPSPYWTVAWDAKGAFLWSDEQPGDINAALGPARVDVDGNGDILLNAVPETTCGLHQFRIWKLDADGNRRWDRFYPDSACDIREPTAFALDGSGNIIVTGFGVAQNTGLDTVKYAANGERLWQRLFHQPGNSVDQPHATITDDVGCVYVVGTTTIAVPLNIDYDLTIVKYAPDGRLVWDIILKDDGPSRGYSIALGADRAVHVVGHGEYDGETGVIVMRYEQHFSPADLTGEGFVDLFDLLELLSAWGPCPIGEPCAADLDANGTVNVFDLLDLLSEWGRIS